MKNNLLSGVIVIVLIVIGGYVLLNQGSEETILENDQLIVNKFQYTYDGMVSHVCPGSVESFSILYEGRTIEITAQYKTFNEGLGRDITDYPDCENRGTLISFYDNGEGLPSGLPGGCEVIEQLPSNFDEPEFLVAECSSQITFQIEDLNAFNSCISQEDCVLIHGEDINLLK
jgi:hypothetical protein